MKFWKWQKGRQESTDYSKFPLFAFRIWKWGFDGYILKYAPFAVLNWHKDPVKDGKHWRINYTLAGMAEFCLKREQKTNCYDKSIKFRPDIEEHKLEVYREGCTKLSLGFVKFN